jgi:hypothetical protein
MSDLGAEFPAISCRLFGHGNAAARVVKGDIRCVQMVGRPAKDRIADNATLTKIKLEARREQHTLFGCAYIAFCVSQALLDSFVADDYENLLYGTNRN